MKLVAPFLFLIFSFPLFSQQKQTEGDKAFDNYNYKKAINAYEREVENGEKSAKIFKRLGDSYYFNAKLAEANKWYEQLINLGSEVEPEYLYRYAQTLKSIKKYDKANAYMEKFTLLNANDKRAILFNENPDYLNDIELQSGRYEVTPVAFNTPNADFSPTVVGDKLVFSSSLNKSLFTKFIHEWDEKPFIDLYEVSINGNTEEENTPKKLKGRINTSFHESSTTFTADGNTVYFTRNSKRKEQAGTLNRLKLYKAIKKKGRWVDVEALPFTDDNYTYAHPSLSKDGTKLYFASDMKGTKGYGDIFVVDVYEDGTFSKPKNLGDMINTEGRETFPYISMDNKLYFASDGHLGLGGLDVFTVQLDADSNPITNVVNVGRPVNSPNDDFSFTINDETKKGYYSSNREGGKGGDDIYSFTETKPLIEKIDLIVSGQVKAKESDDTIKVATIQLLDEAGTLIEEITTDDGTYSFTVDATKNHRIRATAADYLMNEVLVNKTNKAASTTVDMLLDADKAITDVNDDLSKILQLQVIYFEFDSAKIQEGSSKAQLDKVVEVMNLYPQITIEVRSHTDSRADDSYNMALSNRRAESTVKYLVSKGVDASRLSGKGYGESQLINQCANGVPCSKADHELNRRSEFVIVSQ
ncbi:OmpA family protein [Spongiivirga sp. MCCC 1A20706]|uniref:OmpA family protein n=1 Tax=Spongiivirga sp. MCCC 1A20706 TaxID=3160963 RepID=UPI003977B097